MKAPPSSAVDYWRHEALDKIVTLAQSNGTIEPADESAALAPQLEDLVRLHRLARQRMAQTVLEFGIGYSTVVLADALAKNERDFMALPERPRLRNANAFKLFSVDANRHWMEVAQRRIPASLAPRIATQYSRVVASTFNGRLCHYYETLPNVVPDFIYLDGPSPQDVEGSVNGLDFSIDERTVMAADLLLIEPSLLPGAFILVDGRVNNARFLERNFQRSFRRDYDPAGDITTFELVEPPLGRHSVDLAALVARHRTAAP